MSCLLEFAGKIVHIMNHFFFVLFSEYCKQAFGDLNVSVFESFKPHAAVIVYQMTAPLPPQK